MSALRATLLALAAFAVAALAAVVTTIARDEIRTRLGDLPRPLIRLAALRPSRILRERLDDEWDDQVDEWRREVAGILHDYKDKPVTGLAKALRYAVVVVACSPEVARELSGTTSRSRPQVATLLALIRGKAAIRRPVALTLALAAALTAVVGVYILQSPPGWSGTGAGIAGAGQGPAAGSATHSIPAGRPILMSHDTRFTMPGNTCQNIALGNATTVSFTQQGPMVEVADSTGAGMDLGGDMDLSCNGAVPMLAFQDQVAMVAGNPTPAQCTTAINAAPVMGTLSLTQLEPGQKFCFISGSGNAPSLMVLATLASVAGSPSFATTWAVTWWRVPSPS